MSYDLLFATRTPPPPAAASLSKFCEGRPHFKQSAFGAEGQWIYQHPDTGVYFTLDYLQLDGTEESSVPKGFHDSGIAFNLNYARPHFFGMEAMPLIEELCSSLDLLVIDPQGDAHPQSANASQLNGSWDKSNVLAIQGLHKEEPRLPHWPRERSLGWWLYQRQKKALEETLGDTVYVPNILLFKTKAGSIMSGVVWTDCIPFVFPHCDIVIMSKLEGRFFGFGPKQARIAGWLDADAVRREMSTTLTQVQSEIGNIDMLAANAAKRMRNTFDQFAAKAQEFAFERIAPDGFVDAPT